MIAGLSVNGGGGGGGGTSGGNVPGSGGNQSVGGPVSRVTRGLALHRSNSSLELPHSPDPGSRVPETPLRREYGSHGSIDVVAQSVPPGDNLLAMFQDLRPSDLSPSRVPELLLRRQTHHHHHHHQLLHLQQQQQPAFGSSQHAINEANVQSPDSDEICGGPGSTAGSSPKLRLKLNRLWGGNKTSNQRTSSGNGSGNNNCENENNGGGSATSSIIGCVGGAISANSNSSSGSSTPLSADVEERHRRRAFAHYDCQSLTANLGYAAKLRGILLARRRNTATGASAASSLRASTPDEGPEDDAGDGRGNELLESCPFFLNEIGGEGEREVGLTRVSATKGGIHRPSLAYGVSVLEPTPGESLWKQTCPLQKRPLPIESIDEGAHYYRRYFLGREHQNWFGMDEQLGPVAISIRKDEKQQYRIIVRTSELLTLRGSVPKEALPVRQDQTKIPTREILDLVAPEIQMNCLRLGTQAAEEPLARLDEQGLSNRYKVGVLYCKAGQRTEEEMYNNQHAGPAFLEFLDTIGQRVRLRGFEGYKAGLDTRTDSTGTHAVVATHRNSEVTFHVSTMLPFTPNNRQQLLRKRHIGNDIVTIVFQEPGALPFSPKRIRSQFQHVFVIVRVVNPCTESTQYNVAVSRSKDVPVFGPPIPEGGSFSKGKLFADFLLAKVINAENAAHRSEKFSTMATRTRQEYLKDLCSNYSSTSIVESGPKFSMLSFSTKKKSQNRPKLTTDASQRGAICWQVILMGDANQDTECYLGISIETIVLIEEHSKQTVFVTPCLGVLGWHAQTNAQSGTQTKNTESLRLYYHQGECITIRVRTDHGDRDELMEIVERLRAVTNGSPASELSLKRNSLGQLGFHVQPDGVVTQVESVGSSWQAGLRQGSRLVEICKVAVSTLSHDQMVDLLKTSAQVTVTVIPPACDGNPRRGCLLQNCQYLSNLEGEYENMSSPDGTPNAHHYHHQSALARRYERSFSPPRSSNSSGYGTGSSSRSFNDPRFPIEGTITGSSADDRWYELLESQELESPFRADGTPPPLPARQNFQAGTPNKCTPKKVDKESHYAIAKNYADGNLRQHHNHVQQHNHESNYVSPRMIQESIRQGDYQRLDLHRNQEQQQQQVSTSFVKLQKEKYETKQENLYASQRDLQKNDAHQKLSLANPLSHSQNPNYSVPKPISSNSIVHLNEFDHSTSNGKIANNVVVTNGSHHRNSNNFENLLNGTTAETTNITTVNNKLTNGVTDHQDSMYDRRRSKHESELLHQLNNLDDIGEENHGGSQILQPHDFKVGEKVTCLKASIGERPMPHKVSIEYRNKDFSSNSLPAEVNGTTDGSALPSEDELSNSSGNVSPRLRRANKHRPGNLTPSGNNSRNQSPRPKSNARNSHHRNSANLSSSTFQEDLMKLINPDFISADDTLSISSTHSLKGGSLINNKLNNNLLEIQNRCRSRENLCGNSNSTLMVIGNGTQENGSANSEVVLTMARPPTVVTSTASSPAPSENKLTREERLSPRVTKTPPQSKSNKEPKAHPDTDTESWHESNNRTSSKRHDYNENSNGSSSDRHGHMSSLELRMARETRHRLSLEEENRRLRDENRRLQDENHAATQQIRRFTEWFIIYHR